jgi:hypothetical protein
VSWLARTVIPQLAREPSTVQMAEGWRVSAARLAPVEDHLARLEASAPNPHSAARARTLREAMRSAAVRINALLATADLTAARPGLAGVRAELETALASTGQGTTATPPGAHHP